MLPTALLNFPLDIGRHSHGRTRQNRTRNRTGARRKRPWPEIYKTLIDGDASTPFYECIHQSGKLRRAVAALVKRRMRM
jgi:hypothetical protein